MGTRWLRTRTPALAQSSYPKLLLAGNPGALSVICSADSFVSGLSNCGVIHIGPGMPDNPKTIGSAVPEWLTASNLLLVPENSYKRCDVSEW